MSSNSSQSSLDDRAVVTIEIVPMEEEEEDLNTFSAIEKVHMDVKQEMSSLEGYSVQSIPSGERGIDIILLAGAFITSIITNKDLVISFFNVISTSIQAVSKQGRVQEIEITVNGATLSLKDVSKTTAKELIEIFEEHHSEVMTSLTPRSNLKVTAKVSKKSKRKN